MKRELFWAAIECLEEGIPEWSAHYRNLSLAIKVLRYAGKGDCGAILAACDKAQREAEKGEKNGT